MRGDESIYTKAFDAIAASHKGFELDANQASQELSDKIQKLLLDSIAEANVAESVPEDSEWSDEVEAHKPTTDSFRPVEIYNAPAWLQSVLGRDRSRRGEHSPYMNMEEFVEVIPQHIHGSTAATAATAATKEVPSFRDDRTVAQNGEAYGVKMSTGSDTTEGHTVEDRTKTAAMNIMMKRHNTRLDAAAGSWPPDGGDDAARYPIPHLPGVMEVSFPLPCGLSSSPGVEFVEDSSRIDINEYPIRRAPLAAAQRHVLMFPPLPADLLTRLGPAGTLLSLDTVEALTAYCLSIKHLMLASAAWERAVKSHDTTDQDTEEEKMQVQLLAESSVLDEFPVVASDGETEQSDDLR